MEENLTWAAVLKKWWKKANPFRRDSSQVPFEPVPVIRELRRSSWMYAEKGGEKLELDLYQPLSDSSSSRPEFLVLFVHGGGFSEGQRDDPRYVQFANKLVQEGFAVAAMSYRLTMKGRSFGCDQPAVNKVQTFRDSAEDIWDATRSILDYMEREGQELPGIILCGSSAGAEAVLHAAYWPEPALSPRFRYSAVVGMAAALINLDWITPENARPMLLFHGVDDPLVPFGSASHHYCPEGQPGFLLLHGSGSIAARLKALEQPYKLVKGLSGGHGWADKPMFDHLDIILSFIERCVKAGAFLQEESELRWR